MMVQYATVLFHNSLIFFSQWGTVDADFKVTSRENPEIAKVLETACTVIVRT